MVVPFHKIRQNISFIDWKLSWDESVKPRVLVFFIRRPRSELEQIRSNI